jgi:multidrug efflux pump subunit AcrA (membrane-fusion protein)
MKQARFLLILLIGFSAALAACQPTTAAETSQADVSMTDAHADKTAVTTKGEVIPLRQATLSFQSGGPVLSVMVSNGDLVQAGDPLVQLDDTNQQIALTQAEARLAQAQANLQTAESLLALAQTNLETARLGMTAAQTRSDILTEDPSARADSCPGKPGGGSSGPCGYGGSQS